MAERQSDETSVNRSSEDGSDVTPLSLDSLPSGVIDIIPPAQVNDQSTIDTKVADTSQKDKDKDKAPFDTNKKAGNNEPAGIKKVEITSKEIQTTSKTTDREVQTAATTADKEVQTTVQSTPDRLSSVWMVYAVAFLSVCICLVAILVNASWGTTKINDSDSEALLKQLLSGCRLEAEGNKTIREGLKKQVEQLNKTGLDLSDELNSNIKKLKTLKTLNKDLEDSKTQMRNTITELKNENQRLENRFGEALSHVAKEDSDNITQMEEHSKEKIAEEFKELYANEYTKAVIEMEKRGISVGPKKDTQFFLEILKLADDLCRNYSASHLNSIRQSITNLQIDVPSDQAKKTINVPVDDKMSKIERSKIFDIKKTAALRLLEPVTKVLTDFIATKFDVDQGKQPKLFSYIKKCVYLCWMMNIHSNPVHMKFFQPSDQTEFDSDMFRTFLTAGKYIDYIVWPPLYTFDSGKMLAKGIAEGKD